MNSTHVQPTEKRTLGLYAIHWAQAIDWLRVRTRRQTSNQSTASTGELISQAEEQAAEKDDSAAKEVSKIKEEKKLKAAVAETHRVLAQTQSVFPFMLFPDRLTVDRQKLTIVYKKFFNVHQTVSVPLESVKNVLADLGPFLGSLTITSDLFINNVQTVTCLPRKDVREIQTLVQGIVTAISEKIDLSKIETDELKDLLCKLGEGHYQAVNK